MNVDLTRISRLTLPTRAILIKQPYPYPYPLTLYVGMFPVGAILARELRRLDQTDDQERERIATQASSSVAGEAAVAAAVGVPPMQDEHESQTGDDFGPGRALPSRNSLSYSGTPI